MEAPDVVRTVAVALSKAGLDPNDPTLFPILTAAANCKEKQFNPFASACSMSRNIQPLSCTGSKWSISS